MRFFSISSNEVCVARKQMKCSITVTVNHLCSNKYVCGWTSSHSMVAQRSETNLKHLDRKYQIQQDKISWKKKKYWEDLDSKLNFKS